MNTPGAHQGRLSAKYRTQRLPAKRNILEALACLGYLDAVEEAFGADIDCAMLVKQYGEPEGKKASADCRYSPAVGTGAVVHTFFSVELDSRTAKVS